MSFIDLSTAIMNVEAILDKQYESIDPDAPSAETIMTICHNFRIIASGNYLANLDAEEFCETLANSASLYLEMVTDEENREKLDPYYLCTGRATPLIDALACGEFETAKEIAAALPTEINADQGETEEDFFTCYLLSRLLLSDDLSALETTLEELPDNDEPLFLMLKAIIKEEPNDFYTSLFELVDSWKDSIDIAKESDSVPYYDSLTTAYICIEAIGYLKLGMKFGIPPIDTELFYVPKPIVEYMTIDKDGNGVES